MTDRLRELWRALGTEPTERILTRAVFLRALALVHLVALGGLWWQIHGLIGSEGILPVAEALEAVAARTGPERWWEVPTLLWLWPTDAALHVLCGLGMVLAALVLAGAPLEGWWLLGLVAIHLSLGTAGQVFLSFQWDTLLVEATFASLFVARFAPGTPRAPAWGFWLLWLVLARLMFFGGLVKLTSGDPTWRDLSALTYHYWTQPLPNPVSWYAHQLPLWFHQLSVVVTFVIELGFPLLIVLGRRLRLVACGGFVGLLVLLALTGNYGWFQLLAIVLCLTLVDDSVWKRVLPHAVVDRLWEAPSRPTIHLGIGVGLAVALVGVLVSAAQLGVELPDRGITAIRTAGTYRVVNGYGLFAVMTTERPELELQASDDGVSWRPYVLPAKPGDPGRTPPQVAPYHPRLDWQLWFAALGSCRGNPWVVRLMRRLTEGSEPVLALFEEVPLERPRYVRVVRYRYELAPFGSDDVWTRELEGLYCPVVRLSAGRAR